MARTPRVTVWTPASSIKPHNTQWLWWPWIPGGHLTIIAGRGGSGKGLLVTDLIARITTAREWPMSAERAPLGRCILVEAEDDPAETLRPRLDAAKADAARVMVLPPSAFFSLPPDFAKENDVRLIVLSPLVSCLEGIEDTNKELDVRDRLDTLMEQYRGTGIAIIGLMHLNKKENLSTVERILGSGAFANFSRCVLFAIQEKDKPNKRLVHEKYNLSPKADDLLFTPKAVGDQRTQYVNIVWDNAQENADLDAMLERKRGNGKVNGHGKTQISAEMWTVAYLTEKDGRSPKVDVIASGVAAGYTKKALQHALDRTEKFRAVLPSGDNRISYWELSSAVAS